MIIKSCKSCQIFILIAVAFLCYHSKQNGQMRHFVSADKTGKSSGEDGATTKEEDA